MRRLRTLLGLTLLQWGFAAACAGDRFVATDGDDESTGSAVASAMDGAGGDSSQSSSQTSSADDGSASGPTGGGGDAGADGSASGNTTSNGATSNGGAASGTPGGSGPGGTGGTGGTGGCLDTTCTIDDCEEGTTTLSGVVYDPSGTLPLYNALVYVPSASLGAVASAPSCERCGAVPSGEPLAVTLSNARGEFVLSNVPSGTSVPLVVQVGKWRRQVVVPAVTACVDNPLDGSALTRLPRNRAEGDIPLIAMVTGHSDALECLLLKLGIDTAEFTTDAGAGRVHMYYGGAANTDGAGATSFAAELGQASFAHASTLWGNEGKLSGYDAVLLSCEGSQLPDEKDPYLANFKAFVDGGGRAWVGHTHSYWLRRGPDPLPSTAEYIGVGQALPEPFTLSVDTAFAKGAAFSEWLALVGATTTPGTLTLDDGEHSVAAAVPPTQRWLYASSNPNDPTVAVVEQLTFNTPVGAAAQSSCGRVLFTDNHVKAGGSGDDSDPEKPFPSGCSSQPLSAQQKAAAFALFDLLSCIQPDSVAPSPPSIP